MTRSIDWSEQDVTIAKAITEGAQYFEQFDLSYSHGSASAMDEAAWLVLEGMKLSPLEAPDYDALLSAADKVNVIAFLEKRATQRIPAAYLTQKTWFAGLEFYVDQRVLIPRSPLAEPIMQGFGDFLDTQEVTRVLDMCTGGGCIAIACAYAFADSQVDAVDLSEKALEVAAINIEKHGLDSRVTTMVSDVFDQMTAENQYDLIISNPPYVDQMDMDDLHDEFKHEPVLGLASGKDGLDVTRKILADASRFLSPSGVLVCEVGNSAPALEAAFPNMPFLWLEFEHGGQGIFLITREELINSVT